MKPIVRRPRTTHRPLGEFGSERGSAVTEFVMVSGLLVFLLFAVLQVAGVLYLRSIAGAAAAEGARFAANSDVDPASGGPRARQLLDKAAGGSLARSVQCTGDLLTDHATNLPVARVICRGSIASILLPLGALASIHAEGEALKEPA